MEVFQPVLLEVGVYLGGGYANMTEHFLNAFYVSAAFEQVCSETMPQAVGADLFFYTRPGDIFLDNPPDISPIECLTASAEK